MTELLYSACIGAAAFILVCHVYAVTSSFNTQPCPPISFSISSSHLTTQLSKVMSAVAFVLVTAEYMRSFVGLAAVLMAACAMAVCMSPMSSHHTEVRTQTPRVHSRVHGTAACLVAVCAFAIMVTCMHSPIHAVPVCLFATLGIVFARLTYKRSSCQTFSQRGILGFIEYVMVILFIWVVGDK